MNYINQIKADRRAAAQERAAERKATGRDYRDEINALWGKTDNGPAAADRRSSITRRLDGRMANIESLCLDPNAELGVIIFKALKSRYTEEELLGMYQGQTRIVRKMHDDLVNMFDLQVVEPVVFNGQDDEYGNLGTNSTLNFLFIPQAIRTEVIMAAAALAATR